MKMKKYVSCHHTAKKQNKFWIHFMMFKLSPPKNTKNSMPNSPQWLIHLENWKNHLSTRPSPIDSALPDTLPLPPPQAVSVKGPEAPYAPGDGSLTTGGKRPPTSVVTFTKDFGDVGRWRNPKRLKEAVYGYMAWCKGNPIPKTAF